MITPYLERSTLRSDSTERSECGSGVSTSSVCQSIPYDVALTRGPPTRAMRGSLTKWIFDDPKLVAPVQPESIGVVATAVSRAMRSRAASASGLLLPLRTDRDQRAEVRYFPVITSS